MREGLIANAPDNPFQRTLAREMLLSERRRVTLLAAFLFVLAAGVVVATYVPGAVIAPMREKFKDAFGGAFALFAGAAAYELLARAYLSRLLRTSRPLFAPGRYLNTLIEITFASAATLLAARVNPKVAMLGNTTLLYFPFILLATLQLDFWLSCFSGVLAMAQYLAMAAWWVPRMTPDSPLDFSVDPGHHVARGLLFLLTALAAGFVAVQVRRQFARSVEAAEERNRVVGLFGQHVSPQVVEMLLKQGPALGGETRHVCVMFFDIRDFTRTTEPMSPQAIMGYLNTLFPALIAVINRHGGIVNKFLGDGFMAVFGAPVLDGEDCRHAVEAATEILACVERMNRAGLILPTRAGMGLHAGRAVTGNVGSPERQEYTVIGSVVNTASRIESANKQFGSQLLVSAEVWSALRSPPPGATPLGPVPIRGQHAPLDLYRLA